MKKQTSMIVCLLLAVAMLLASCAPSVSNGNETTEHIGGNDPSVRLNITGKEAAELLLTRDRLDDSVVGNGLTFLGRSSSGTESLAANLGAPVVSLAGTDVLKSLMTPLSESVVIDEGGGRFVIDGNTWEWSDLQEQSTEISLYESYVTNIEHRARSFAELIREIKTRINITDKWIDMGGGQMFLLTVGESSETVYSTWGAESYDICNHYVDESGQDVYDMFSYIPHDNGDLGKLYMRYIAGAHYEFAYDFTPIDGDPMRTQKSRIIVENSRGYWNMICLDEVSAYEGMGTRYNLGNLVAKDGVVYQVQVDMMPNQPLSETFYSAAVISSDWKNDILRVSGGEMWLNVGAFEGIHSMRVEDVTADPEGSYRNEDRFGDAQHPTYTGYGAGLSAVLTNGKVVKHGDSFAGGKIVYERGEVRNHLPVGAEHGSVIYLGHMHFGFRNDNSYYAPSADEVDDLLTTLIAELGITPKYEMSMIANALKEACSFVDYFGQYYEWCGYKVETVDNLIAANVEYVKRFDPFVTMMESARSLPTVKLDDYLEPIPETLEFATFSGYSYGKITISDGVITAEGMVASLPEHVLFDDGGRYVLRLGLRKYQADSDALSETIVVLHGAEETASTFAAGSAISFEQASTYVIPDALSEGRYLLVAFVATLDEGIRVSQTVPLASVDFASGTVESEVAEITYEKVQDDMLVVTSRSKLYTEVVLDPSKTYDKEAFLEQMTCAILAVGTLSEDAKLELYDFETGTATPLPDDFVLAPGTYRLKYASSAHGDADAFVYCVLTEELIAPPSAEEETLPDEGGDRRFEENGSRKVANDAETLGEI